MKRRLKQLLIKDEDILYLTANPDSHRNSNLHDAFKDLQAKLEHKAKQLEICLSSVERHITVNYPNPLELLNTLKKYKKAKKRHLFLPTHFESLAVRNFAKDEYDKHPHVLFFPNAFHRRESRIAYYRMIHVDIDVTPTNKHLAFPETLQKHHIPFTFTLRFENGTPVSARLLIYFQPFYTAHYIKHDWEDKVAFLECHQYYKYLLDYLAEHLEAEVKPNQGFILPIASRTTWNDKEGIINLLDPEANYPLHLTLEYISKTEAQYKYHAFLSVLETAISDPNNTHVVFEEHRPTEENLPSIEKLYTTLTNRSRVFYISRLSNKLETDSTVTSSLLSLLRKCSENCPVGQRNSLALHIAGTLYHIDPSLSAKTLDNLLESIFKPHDPEWNTTSRKIGKWTVNRTGLKTPTQLLKFIQSNNLLSEEDFKTLKSLLKIRQIQCKEYPSSHPKSSCVKRLNYRLVAITKLIDQVYHDGIYMKEYGHICGKFYDKENWKTCEPFLGSISKTSYLTMDENVGFIRLTTKPVYKPKGVGSHRLYLEIFGSPRIIFETLWQLIPSGFTKEGKPITENYYPRNLLKALNYIVTGEVNHDAFLYGFQMDHKQRRILPEIIDLDKPCYLVFNANVLLNLSLYPVLHLDDNIYYKVQKTSYSYEHNLIYYHKTQRLNKEEPKDLMPSYNLRKRVVQRYYRKRQNQLSPLRRYARYLCAISYFALALTQLPWFNRRYAGIRLASVYYQKQHEFRQVYEDFLNYYYMVMEDLMNQRQELEEELKLIEEEALSMPSITSVLDEDDNFNPDYFPDDPPKRKTWSVVNTDIPDDLLSYVHERDEE